MVSKVRELMLQSNMGENDFEVKRIPIPTHDSIGKMNVDDLRLFKDVLVAEHRRLAAALETVEERLGELIMQGEEGGIVYPIEEDSGPSLHLVS